MEVISELLSTTAQRKRFLSMIYPLIGGSVTENYLLGVSYVESHFAALKH